MKKIPTKQVTLTVPDLRATIAEHWSLLGFVGKLLGLAILLAGVFYGGMYYERNYMNLNENIERQRDGKLTPEERKLQEADAKINRLQAEIKTAEQLKKDAEKDKAYAYGQLSEMVRKYDLKVDSLTKIIAELKGATDKGTFKFEYALNGAQSFLWSDEYNRFHLLIPDTKEQKSYFTYDQHFQMNLIALKQQPGDGALRVQTVHLYETTGDGKIIGETTIDMSKSTFSYVIDSDKNYPKHNWLVCLDTKGELLVTYLPIHRFGNLLGVGLSAGANSSNSKFVGVTGMIFPPTWTNTGFGVGLSAGYSPGEKGIAYRAQISWSFNSLLHK